MLLSFYNNGDLYEYGGNTYEDSVLDTIKGIKSETNALIYYLVMYRVVKSSVSQHISFSMKSMDDYWESVEKLLNCLNAIYSFKEYIDSEYCDPNKDNYNENVRKIKEKYYQSFQWYTFACNYRNRIIHQAAFAKDFDPETGDTFIDLDEFHEYLEKLLGPISKKNKNTLRIIRFVDQQMEYSLIKQDGHRCLPTKYVVDRAFHEVQSMFDDICMELFSSKINIGLQHYVRMMIKTETGFADTRLMDTDGNTLFLLNLEFESLIVNICLNTEGDSKINKALYNMLTSLNYKPLYYDMVFD